MCSIQKSRGSLTSLPQLGERKRRRCGKRRAKSKLTIFSGDRKTGSGDDMTKGVQILSTANLAKVLDILVERPSWPVAMKCIGGSDRTAFEWRGKCMKAMKEND